RIWSRHCVATRSACAATEAVSCWRAALIVGIADAESFRMELREELRRFGYVQGRNVLFEFRSAEENSRVPRDALDASPQKIGQTEADQPRQPYQPRRGGKKHRHSAAADAHEKKQNH